MKAQLQTVRLSVGDRHGSLMARALVHEVQGAFACDGKADVSVPSAFVHQVNRHVGVVPGGKGRPTDAGTRVPLIANGPGVRPGRVSKDLVDFSDFLPTICQAAGVTVPEKLTIDGRSFLPQLRGEKGNPREWIYCWNSRGGGPKAQHEFARDQRYKLYRNGRFYDVAEDVLEKKPLDPASLGKDARAARDKLAKALERYRDARPERLQKPKRRGGERKKLSRKVKL